MFMSVLITSAIKSNKSIAYCDEMHCNELREAMRPIKRRNKDET